MGTAAWRRLVLVLCALALIQVGVVVWMTASFIAGFDGIAWTATNPIYVPRSASHTPFVDGVTVAEGSAAYRTGLRTGDLVDLRALNAADRYRFLTTFPRAGQRIDLTVVRNGRTLQIPIVAAHAAFTWDVWLAYLGFAWMLLFAALISWRRPDSAEARVLALLLIVSNVGNAFGAINWTTPSAAADAIACAFSAILFYSGYALFATYAMLFAGPTARLPRVLAWLSYASAAAAALYGVAYVVGVWTLRADPAQSWYSGPLGQTVTGILPWGFPLLCVAVTIAQTRGVQRARIAWTTSSLGLMYLVYTVTGAIVVFAPGFGSRAILSAQNIVSFIAPLGLTYSLLNRRLLDINFALNRAVVFSGVSIVVVGIFVLAEWILSEWFNAGHTTNLAISAALALALGFSVRSIHQRVDHLLDNVFFRKRHEDERAIRTFAHEAAYITDAPTLLHRAEATLETHADASSVDVVLDDGAGSYGNVSENDPAIIALQAWRKTVDLHTVDTGLQGEFAYPMIARGRLVGALVLGPKRSGETYAPDESDAIFQLAHALATSLDVLSANGDGARDSIVIAIAAMSERLSNEIRSLSNRLPQNSPVPKA
jgi:hypothetical protein